MSAPEAGELAAGDPVGAVDGVVEQEVVAFAPHVGDGVRQRSQSGEIHEQDGRAGAGAERVGRDALLVCADALPAQGADDFAGRGAEDGGAGKAGHFLLGGGASKEAQVIGRGGGRATVTGGLGDDAVGRAFVAEPGMHGARIAEVQVAEAGGHEHGGEEELVALGVADAVGEPEAGGEEVEETAAGEEVHHREHPGIERPGHAPEQFVVREDDDGEQEGHGAGAREQAHLGHAVVGGVKGEFGMAAQDTGAAPEAQREGGEGHEVDCDDLVHVRPDDTRPVPGSQSQCAGGARRVGGREYGRMGVRGCRGRSKSKSGSGSGSKVHS